MVAIEMPVEPTVPSKMREPVCGTSSPSRSAVSMTGSISVFKRTQGGLCRATRSLTEPPGLRNCVDQRICRAAASHASALPCPRSDEGIQSIDTHEDLTASELRQRRDPDERRVSDQSGNAIDDLRPRRGLRMQIASRCRRGPSINLASFRRLVARREPCRNAGSHASTQGDTTEHVAAARRHCGCKRSKAVSGPARVSPSLCPQSALKIMRADTVPARPHQLPSARLGHVDGPIWRCRLRSAADTTVCAMARVSALRTAAAVGLAALFGVASAAESCTASAPGETTCTFTNAGQPTSGYSLQLSAGASARRRVEGLLTWQPCRA